MSKKAFTGCVVKWLLLVLVVLVQACSDDEKNEPRKKVQVVDNQPIVLYLIDSTHEMSRPYAKELAKVFDYNKISYATQELPDYADDPYIDPSVRVVYINTTQNLDDLGREILVEFVAMGGTLVFPSLNEDPNGGFLSGIDVGADFMYDLESQGIHFVKNMVPGMEGKSIYPQKKNIGLKRESFKDSINVLATAATDPTQPLIFEHYIGAGRVVHFNTNMVFEKPDRGLLFAPALKGLQGVPYPIVSVGAIFIDDFPSPLYDYKAEPIASELDITQAEYVMDVWWPDMLKVAEQFNIDYSAYPCFNYDRIKQPPFIFREWDMHRSIRDGKEVISANWMTKQVIKHKFEMAFHGYNHESLVDTIWRNPEYMEGALIAARKKWRVNGFGPFPVTYVPPSNDIDSIGLVHLANAMPEIEFMCSIYEGDFYEGGEREYDVDPLEPRLFDFPRVSSGYVFSDFKTYSWQSLYLFTGIWSHFIHPDDIYQLPVESNTSAGDYAYRNAERLGWYTSSNNRKGMLTRWVEYLEEVTETHPSMRFLDVATGATITRDWRNSKYEYIPNGDTYNVKKVSANKWKKKHFFWNVFVEKTNQQLLQEELQRKGLNYTKTPVMGGYLLTVETPEAAIAFSEGLRFKNTRQYSLDEIFADIKDQFKGYEEKRKTIVQEVDEGEYVEEIELPVTVEDSVQYFVENENLDAATNILLRQLRESTQPDTAIFSQYALYLAYNEKPQEVWGFLENTYKESPKTAMVYLNHYLATEAYPNEELNELWLRRKIECDPTNMELIKEYMQYFYTDQYKEQVKEMLVNAQEGNSAEEAYALYVRYLIDWEPEELHRELVNKSPERYPKLLPMATSIAYAFSDNGMLQDALLWAEYSNEISMLTQLQWWADLEAFNKMETVYLRYIKNNPNDEEVKSFVANTWFDIGEFERAGLVAKSMNNPLKKDSLRERINPEAQYFESDVQKFMILNTPGVFYPDTLQNLLMRLRYNEHASVEYTTDFVEDNFNQSVWNNMVTLHMKTRNLNQHSLSVTYSDVSDLVINTFDANNVAHQLYGLRYRYQTRENTDKPIFYALAGLEKDDLSNTFFSLGAGISQSNEKSFKSIGYTFSPVKTGPAISREIYWGELVGYYERGYNKAWQTSLSPVLSHYTTGVYEGAITGRLFYNIKPLNKSRFSPFAEAFGSVSNGMQEGGNPFWVVERRFYGGGGLAWNYGRDQTRKPYMRVEAGAFYDTYTGNFLRITGNFAFPIKKYTFVTGQFEFYNQALYYSNGFQLGIRHFFRRRKPYYVKPREYDDWYDE